MLYLVAESNVDDDSVRRAIADLAVLRNQPELFGPVASDATAWRVLADVDAAALARLRSARAAAREVAWAQRTETSGDLPVSTAAGRPIPGRHPSVGSDLDQGGHPCRPNRCTAAKTDVAHHARGQ